MLKKQRYIHRHPKVPHGIELLNRSLALQSQAQVPIIAQIAAGEPIPLPTPETWDITASAKVLEVTINLTRDGEMVYALEVKGLSMVDTLINGAILY